MLKILLASLLTLCSLCPTVMAQQGEPVPTLKEDSGVVVATAERHLFIKPDFQLAPLPLADPSPAITVVELPKPEFDATFWALTGVLAAGIAADIYTTKKALERGAIEINPLFARDGGRRVDYALNIGLSAAQWGVAVLLQKMGMKTAARWLLGATAAIRFGVAIRSNGVMR